MLRNIMKLKKSKLLLYLFFISFFYFFLPVFSASKWDNDHVSKTNYEPAVADIHIGISLNRNKIAFRKDCFKHNRPVYWGFTIEQTGVSGVIEIAVYKDDELYFIKNIKILPLKKYYWFRSIFKIGKYRLEVLDKDNQMQKIKIFEVVY